MHGLNTSKLVLCFSEEHFLLVVRLISVQSHRKVVIEKRTLLIVEQTVRRHDHQ
jgi:hypothetical protein